MEEEATSQVTSQVGGTHRTVTPRRVEAECLATARDGHTRGGFSRASRCGVGGGGGGKEGAQRRRANEG